MGVVSLQQAVHSIHHSLNSWNIALNNNPLIYGDYKMSNISLVDQISSKDRALIHNSFFPRFLSHYKLERKMWADKAIYLLGTRVHHDPTRLERLSEIRGTDLINRFHAYYILENNMREIGRAHV